VLTEVHRPRARQAVDVAGAPLMTQTGHARSQHFPEVALCYAVTRYPLRLGTAFPNFPPSVAVIAYFSLVIGELVPKQIALRNPEKIAVRVAPAMTAIARIASPVVSFLDISGRAVLRALGYQAQAEHRVTDEEIRTLIAEAETAGVIEPGERAMIAGVMRLGDRPIRAVMTPRREVDMIDLTADPEDIRRMIVESIHSRLPVHAGTPEEMVGVVQAKDLLDAYLRDECPDIRAQVRPAANVADTADALDVVDVIKGSPVHMALVHDEYGSLPRSCHERRCSGSDRR